MPEQIVDIELGKLNESGVKLRDVYTDSKEYADLKRNIVLLGVQQPIVVCEAKTPEGAVIPDEYTIADGWHRYNACKDLLNVGMSQFATIPCVVRDMTDEEVQVAQMGLNHARIPTSIKDKKNHLVKWAANHPLHTQKKIAEVFGFTQEDVSKFLSLANLNEVNMELVATEIVTATKAFHWARMPEELQDRYRDEACTMPTNEFIEVVREAIKAYKKTGTVDKDKVIVFKPMTKNELEARWQTYQMQLKAFEDQGKTGTPAYTEIQVRYLELQEIGHVDEAYLTAQKAEKEKTKADRKASKDAEKLGEAQKIIDAATEGDPVESIV